LRSEGRGSWAPSLVPGKRPMDASVTL
jgi:hypothetical protein